MIFAWRNPSKLRSPARGTSSVLFLFDKETVAAIGKYLKARAHIINPSLFLNHRAEPLSRFGVGWLTTKYWKLAQLNCPSLCDIKVTPHTFRHSHAFQSIESGNSITTVQDNPCHASLKTTIRYVHLSMEMPTQSS
jgi:site-specific recombinase XerD